MNMFCPSCGVLLRPEASECWSCGVALSGEAMPESHDVEPPSAGAQPPAEADPTTVLDLTGANYPPPDPSTLESVLPSSADLLWATAITPPTGIPVTVADDAVLAPLAASVAASGGGPESGELPPEEERPGNRPLFVLLGIAAIVVIVIGLLVVKYAGERNEPKLAGNPAPTTVAPTTALGRSTTAPSASTAAAPAAGAPTTAAPATASTAPATTAAATTATTVRPSTTVAPTTTARAATTAPTTAAPSTVVAAPATTAPSGSPEARVQATAQQLATALASGDWPTARRLEPARASWTDQQFTDGYGDLDASTVVPVSTNRMADGRYELKMVLVAFRTIKGAPVTTVFCGDWLVDGTLQRVTQQPTPSSLATRDGWVDPKVASQPYLSACAQV
ncbi:MAG: hypothetical protein AB7L13_12555 [Acidimicrobiia bacterium]